MNCLIDILQLRNLGQLEHVFDDYLCNFTSYTTKAPCRTWALQSRCIVEPRSNTCPTYYHSDTKASLNRFHSGIGARLSLTWATQGRWTVKGIPVLVHALQWEPPCMLLFGYLYQFDQHAPLAASHDIAAYLRIFPLPSIPEYPHSPHLNLLPEFILKVNVPKLAEHRCGSWLL